MRALGRACAKEEGKLPNREVPLNLRVSNRSFNVLFLLIPPIRNVVATYHLDRRLGRRATPGLALKHHPPA